jgi:hypothetical protein
MSKPRVRGTLVTLLIFTAVAVFPNVIQALTSTKGTHKAAAGESRDTGVLMADGGDPVPVPNPIPWPKQSA